MADMVIVKLLLCYAWKGGKLTKVGSIKKMIQWIVFAERRWNGFGQSKAYIPPEAHEMTTALS